MQANSSDDVTDLQFRLQRAKELSKAVGSVISTMEKLETVEDMRQVYLTVGALLGIEEKGEAEFKQVSNTAPTISVGKAVVGQTGGP